MLKRCFDFLLGLIGLVLSLPILLVAGILIKVDSPGPIVFRQKRIGKDSRVFYICKLRTMVKGAECLGPPITARNDPRITQIGTLLRWFKIDELPQLWNVVKGDMSIVGPRPEAPEIVADYTPEDRKVLSVKPGIFGPNQLIARDELDRYPEGVDVERYYRTVILPEKLRVDLDYVAHSSFLWDLILIAEGIWVTLAGSLKARYILEGRRRLVFLCADMAFTLLSYYLAFFLRFDGKIPPYDLSTFFRFSPYLLLICVPLYIYFGLYQTLWQYAGISDIQGVLKAVGLGSLLFAMLSLFQGYYVHPRSIYVLETIFAVLLLGGFRVGVKMFLGHFHKLQELKPRRNVLVVGAGDNGEALVREMLNRPDLGLRPVGFLDNDLSKRGAKIHGLKVFGDCSMMKRVADLKNVKEVVVAVPTLSPEAIQGIFSMCRQAGLRVRIAPLLHRLTSERFVSVKIRDLKIEDLLGRREIKIDAAGISELVTGKTVLVTGGGGTIGAELCRRVAEYKPKTLIIADRSENDLYEIFFELSNLHQNFKLVPSLLDITDPKRLGAIFEEHRPKLVFHAAAYKHVSLMEANVRDAIRNNVLGTRILADLAIRYEAEKFVFISTDKAVNPVSVMGMTKRVAELSIGARQGKGRTQFMIVRFGNVLGSRGSVIPILLRQIELGGPITITDSRMERYFMGLTESVMLILQAALLGRGGETFVLEMGQPIKIEDLARLLIRYAGFQPEEVKIRYIGIREGERLEESLVGEGEAVGQTVHDKIRVVRPRQFRSKWPEGQIEELIKMSQPETSTEVLRGLLQELVASSALSDSSAGAKEPSFEVGKD